MSHTRVFQALFPIFKKLSFLFLVLVPLSMLAACSEDGGSDPAADDISIGKTEGDTFQENQLNIYNSELLAGATTTIEVALFNNEKIFTSPVEIAFSASCATSTFSAATVETVNGIATVEYTAGHCEGVDTITASTTVNDNELVATGDVNITRPVTISISFDQNELDPGQQTNFTVSLFYSNGDPYTEETQIFLSGLVCGGGYYIPSIIISNNGIASGVYLAGICTGVRTIKAEATVNGSIIEAETDITINLALNLSINIGNTSLSPGDSTIVVTELTHSNGYAYTPIVSITFSTTCATSNISPIAANTTIGTAQSTYVAGNCIGTDTVTASTNIEGNLIEASTNINISAPQLNLELGSGAGATFQLGILETGTGNVGAGQSPLSPGGSTSVMATIVDADNTNLLATDFNGNVSFSSPCTAAGQAIITSPIGFTSGIASTTYVSNGCVGDDLVTATVVADGNIKIAQATITSAPQTIGSIQFISNEPEQIAIAGMGVLLPKTSTVTFEVKDINGNPIRDQIVNFSLDTYLGGVDLSATSDVTNAQGIATTIVQSGTISIPVRVTASTTDPNNGTTYSTQSDAIVISSLYPDQDSFSLSFSECNPSAWETDGVAVQVTALAADHFNNPVPDGTAVSFRTEGGSIDGSCLTIDGMCSVTWRSQNPRPNDGRSTILATMIGNESYIDLNSNGRFDDGDVMGDDLSEAWLDINENATYDAGDEEYIDFDLNGEFTPANTFFDGVLCAHSTRCSLNTSIHVRQSGVIHMASNNNAIFIDGGTSINSEFTLPLSTEAPKAVVIAVSSQTGNYPAAGTTIQVETTNGTIVGNSSFEVPDSCNTVPGEAYSAIVYMQGDGQGNTGILTVTATSGGVVTQQIVNVTDLNE